jgi:hypothetical protein
MSSGPPSSSVADATSDAATEYVAETSAEASTKCDPSLFEDAGAGACAPYWLQGDGCRGGEVIFPCGLPPAPDNTQMFEQACATYCLGSTNFDECYVDPGDSGQPARAPWVGDGSTGPVGVICRYIT